VKKTLLLIGGGQAHIEVLRQLALTPPAEADVALFNPSPGVLYAGMLPGVIAGHYEPSEARINLWALCQQARVRFFETPVLSLNANNLVLESGIGERHRFDYASLDVGGISQSVPMSPGAYVVTVKPVEALLAAITEFESVRSASLMVRIVGNGAAALEVALALAFRWRESTNRRVAIVAATRLLVGYAPRVRSLALRACNKLGVAVIENKAVEYIEPTRLCLAGGALVDTQLTVLATAHAPVDLLQKTDLTRTTDGSIQVNTNFQSTNHPHIFAAGDCANISGLTIPKSNVFSVRQGVPLAANLLATLTGAPLEPYRHSKNVLNLLTLGDKRAIATISGLSTAGKWAWRWKDSTDRKWIDRYTLD
jgi:selenide, water dikinase